MKDNGFFKGTTLGVQIGFAGFVVTAIAVGMGFLFVLIDYKLLSQTAFVIAVIGICIGFIGVAYSWVKDSKEAFLGGVNKITKNKWWSDN